MKARTLWRHVRESFKSMARNSWMTFASVSAVTVTLLLVGLFVLVMTNLSKIADDIENDVEIKAFVSLTAADDEVEALRGKIESTPGVSSVAFRTKQQELNKLVKDFGSDLRLFEQDNPLREVYYVKAVDPHATQQVAAAVEKLPGIDEVKYGEGKIERLFAVLKISRTIGLCFVVALLFTAIFLISNTIRITIVARRREIGIMKLVGATNWFVRIPFVFEGMWLGILGSIVPIAAVTALYFEVYRSIEPRLEGQIVQLMPFTPFIFYVDALILLMGMLIGIWGSFLSVRKFLRV